MPSLSASSIGADCPGTDSGNVDSSGIGAPLDRQQGHDPIRLLLLTDTTVASTGGSERFLRNLIAGLPADRYRITLVQLGAFSGPEAHLRILAGGPPVRIINWPVGRVYGAGGWRAMARLRQLLRTERFDIVQSQHEKSDLLNALVRGQPSPPLRLSNRRDMGFKKNWRLRTLFRLVNHRYDGVIAPAPEILSVLASHEGLPAHSMFWIANGVDTQRYRPSPEHLCRECRDALGLSPEHIAFACVASFYPVKCHDMLLEAFARVHRSQPNARLLLIGQGGLQEQLEARARALGIHAAVDFLGARNDIDRLLPAMDVAVLTSSSEGMSNALLEAMACGLPVVATAVGGNRQLVRHEGNGLQVPVGDSHATAEAMLRLAGSPLLRQKMSRHSRERVERDFSLANMVQSYDALYRRLLGCG